MTEVTGYVLSPIGIAYDFGKGEVFVADYDSNVVSVVSIVTHSVVAAVAVGEGPDALAYDSGRGEIFVTNLGSDNVSIISDSMDRVVVDVAVGVAPSGAAYDIGKGEVFVSNGGSRNVSVISDSTNTVVATISHLVSPPEAVTYDIGKGEILVANSGSDNVTVISDATDRSVASVGVANQPVAVVYDEAKGEIFVLNSNAGNVSVINDTTNAVLTGIRVGSQPEDMGIDIQRDELFVTNLFSNNLTVISAATDTAVANVTLGDEPTGVAYDPADLSIYVANTEQGTVSIISPNPVSTYALTFTETGLPSGTSWAVNVNGTSHSSTSPTITFDEPNGTYSFTVERDNPGYTASPSSGSAGVAASTVMRSITFASVPSATYPVVFLEDGLPAGANWTTVLTGVASNTSSTDQIEFDETNGAYAFTASTTSQGYLAEPSSGEVEVNGTGENVSILFALQTGSGNAVTFAETGLPNGTSWSVNMNGNALGSVSNVITTELPNGVFTFNITAVPGYVPSPGSVTFLVAGAPIVQVVTFSVPNLTGPEKSGTGPAPGFLGLQGSDGYDLIGALLAGLGAGAVVGILFGRRRRERETAAPSADVVVSTEQSRGPGPPT